MTAKSEFRKDGRNTPSGRNAALVKLLQQSWAGRDTSLIEREGLGDDGGWTVTYHEPPRSSDDAEGSSEHAGE